MTFHVNHDDLPELDDFFSKEDLVSEFEDLVENLNDVYDKLDSAISNANTMKQSNLSDAIRYVSDEIYEVLRVADNRLQKARELEELEAD